MTIKVKGQVWKFGDDIATSLIAPGQFITGDPEVLQQHVLYGADPEFGKGFERGGIIVAGRNFGCESSREIATQCLKDKGVALIIAEGFGRIFYRNAVAIALPCLILEDTSGIPHGSVVEADLQTGEIVVEGLPKPLTAQPLPGFLLDYFRAGGIIPYVQSQTARS
jgi:3-isopropylmalate/(R)-2-methylmalate dehydratase small subunit